MITGKWGFVCASKSLKSPEFTIAWSLYAASIEILVLCLWDTKESTQILGVQKSEFSGGQKRGINGEVKRGKGVREGKRVGGKGPESILENSDFGTSMI